MTKDNLVPYMKDLSVKEIELIVDAMKELFPHIHAGNLPFFERGIVYDRLTQVFDITRFPMTGAWSEDEQTLRTLMDKFADPWIDVTTIADRQRVYMHVITGERKQGGPLW